MVDFDSDSRVFFADRQDNDEVDEKSYELQLLGTHGDREQFNWVVGYYDSDRTLSSRVPTYHGIPFVCDLIANATLRGVTNADRATCFNNRMRAIGQPQAATPDMTAAQIQTMWTAYTNNPNANLLFNDRGVTPAVLAGLNGPNTELIDITNFNTQALFADLSWRVTDKFTLGLGARSQEDDNGGGTYQIRGANLTEYQPWDDFGYRLSDPFGYTQVSSRGLAAEYDATTARVSVQYQFTDDLMGYVTLSNGYQPGGVSQVPPNVLVRNAAGVATGGLLRDISNNSPELLDLPYQLVRGEERVDSYEIGMKADWADGRLRTNVTAFTTDWENMLGTTYVATVWWDLDGNTFAESRVPCAARCDATNTWEVNYFPNLLNSGVAKAEASGLELEMTWAGGENFQLGFNTGLLDTEFLELGQAGEGTVPAFNEGDGFAGAPDMTANLWGQYDWILANGRSLSARLDYTWTDDYTTFAGGPLQRTQEAFGLLNARLVYDTGQNWQVLIAGTNLTDEYYSPAFFYTVSQQLWDGGVGRPREVYFGLNFSFQ
jgi:iron complex outermembrane recepter protein